MATNLTSTTKAGGDAVTAANNNAIRLDIIQNAGDYDSSGGSSNAYTLSIDSQIAAYDEGQVFKFKANFTNTASATLNVNTIGAKTLKKNGDQNLNAGDIKSGSIVVVVYDGTNMQIISILSNDGDRVIEVFTAGEAINGNTTPQAVYLKSSDGKVYRTDADLGTEETFKFIGFTKANVSTNDSVPVIIAGIVDGFTGLTANSDYFLSDTTGAISTTSGTYKYKVARAMSTTSIMIEKGGKKAIGTDIYNKTADGTTANSDQTITLGFKPKIIKIKYYLQGHTNSGGSNVYVRRVGEAYYEETTIISDFKIGQGGADSDLAEATSFSTESNAIGTPSNPESGDNGSGGHKITISVNSVSDTGFVLRRATSSSSASGIEARSRIIYEAEG